MSFCHKDSLVFFVTLSNPVPLCFSPFYFWCPHYNYSFSSLFLPFLSLFPSFLLFSLFIPLFSLFLLFFLLFFFLFVFLSLLCSFFLSFFHFFISFSFCKCDETDLGGHETVKKFVLIREQRSAANIE